MKIILPILIAGLVQASIKEVQDAMKLYEAENNESVNK